MERSSKRISHLCKYACAHDYRVAVSRGVRKHSLVMPFLKIYSFSSDSETSLPKLEFSTGRFVIAYRENLPTKRDDTHRTRRFDKRYTVVINF